jgi:ligand-binding sensor domain-containing protein/serine phosphatase RsbU (regulator of sigma subunit)
MRIKIISHLACTIFILGVIVSCGQNQDELEIIEDEAVDSTLTEKRNIIGGIPMPVTFVEINPDSILPPEIILANEPVFQTAHSNIKEIDEPILKVLSSSLPHFTLGQDSILEPQVVEALGKAKISGYNEPVTSSKFDFNDAASYNIQGIDVDQGLSSSYVMDMIEDKRGNLWFATWTAGVTMYNGRSFIMFDENKGMESNYIWCIYEDKKGNIWFGSDGAGASVYDGHSFIEYSVGSPLAYHVVLDITGDEEGNVWLATDNGAIMYDGENFLRYGTDQGLSGDYINSVCVAKNGDIWFAIDGLGVNKFDGEGVTHYTINEGLISNNVTCIYEDSEENLWIGTVDSGICMYDGYSFITYQEQMGLPNNYIQSILEDKMGNMWFGTEGGGACMFNRFEFKHFSSQEGMSNDFVWSLLEDSDGNIWFGTFGAGANVYNERSFENYTETQGLNDHIIRYISEDQEGDLWFCTRNGVSKYDGKHFWHYTEEQGLVFNNIRCSLLDQDGNFWFGSNGKGVSKFDGTNFYNYNSSSGLSGDLILSMHEDSQGNVWLGTFGGGVTKYRDGKFSHLSMSGGLADNTVHAIEEDREGNLYFGTKSGGMDIYDGDSIVHILDKQGLIDNSVVSLHLASDGSMWAGSEGYGISHILEDTILQYRLEGGNSHNIIWSIIEDNNGDLWLGTERGLNKFSVDDSLGVEIMNYGKQDGLKGSDFYPSSARIDDQNRLWWGTGKALAMLDLNKYEQNQNAPTIQITDIRLEQSFIDYRKVKDSTQNGHSYYLDNNKEIDLAAIKYNDVTAFTNCPEQLELPYYLNHITFYFSGIDWSAPHKVRYQYMLQGLDPDWRNITYENWAVYSNTPSGEYIFKVRAIGDAGIWSDVISYPVIIHPPWWTTWWAYVLYFLISMLGIYLFIRVRTAKLLLNKKQLEETVTTRTAEVVHQKELVEKKNQEITDSINYAQRIQNAILPPKSLIDKHFKEAFFLYHPKDIVAGDFYWLESFEDHILLAAADCTGHGVPGAMVSVVCHNALNRAVREFKLNSPADVLNQVRELVIEKFTTADTEMRDGMDIALISLNLETKELSYAGANNNLYIVSNGEINEVQADKMPVGRYIVNKEFVEHRVSIKKGDCIYIFTDGFADQFGGPRGKKFKYSAFKQMFLDVNHLPMPEQQLAITKILKNWMGNLEQIDDICIIGVKV